MTSTKIVEQSFKHRDIEAIFIAIFSALAIILHIFQYPFPLATWLKFDLAGVPIAILSLLSLRAGLASLLIFWLGSIMLTTDPTRIIGPSMKTIAEVATAIPLAAIYRKLFTKGFKEFKIYSISFIITLTCRVLLMLLLNYFITPYWLIWARIMETFEAAYNFVIAYLPLNAVFNAIIVCYVVPISIAIWKTIKRYII